MDEILDKALGPLSFVILGFCLGKLLTSGQTNDPNAIYTVAAAGALAGWLVGRFISLGIEYFQKATFELYKKDSDNPRD